MKVQKFNNIHDGRKKAGFLISLQKDALANGTQMLCFSQIYTLHSRKE